MKLLKKQPQEAPDKGASLAALIDQARTAADAYIDQKVAELKASPDGACLPVNMLRQMLTRHDSCACRAAKALLEKKS